MPPIKPTISEIRLTSTSVAMYMANLVHSACANYPFSKHGGPERFLVESKICC